MNYYSTRNHNTEFSFSEAVLLGLAPDGGLFLPVSLPKVQLTHQELEKLSFHERVALLIRPFVHDEIPDADLYNIVTEVFNFPVETKTFDDNYSILELFHGPTLAFKDFGARFLARVLSYFVAKRDRKCVILVATSGDTGSAVANAFYGVEGIQVVLLYPKGKVSFIQEQQLTTFDKNITSYEVDGTFDDCQRLVKAAFMDESLMSKYFLTSANSINIARLLPQSVYYVESYLSLHNRFDKLAFSVPSGNLGNLSAGLLARALLQLDCVYTSSLNENCVFEEYLNTGVLNTRPSVETLSNAMDVGNPSNLERISTLFPGEGELQSFIESYHFSDEQTIEAIIEFYNKYNYVIDPHTAVGYLGAKKSIKNGSKAHQIILSTAHPVKFLSVIEKALNISPAIPDRLAVVLKKEKKVVETGKDYESFKANLVRTIQ